MPRFCANLTLLYQELPLAARFDAAASGGFDAVELLWPDEANETPRELAGLAQDSGIDFTLIDTPRGDTWGNGAHLNQKEAFRHELMQSIETAQILNASHVHIMAGLNGDLAVLQENLAHACDLVPKQSFIIEPISPQAIQGYTLNSFKAAVAILETINRPNAGLLLDTFHAMNMGLDPLKLWLDHATLIRHVQVSSHPARNEPVEGYNFQAFFDQLDRDGYNGDVSGEYHPAGKTSDGLGWLKK